MMEVYKKRGPSEGPGATQRTGAKARTAAPNYMPV